MTLHTLYVTIIFELCAFKRIKSLKGGKYNLMAKGKGYLDANLGLLINLILWFFAGFLLGAITRIMRGQILGAVLSFFLFFIFMWIDLITLVLHQDLTVFA